MASAKTTPLLGQEASQEWHMPISPFDYPDRNSLLSEEERKGVEHLLSFSSWQWKAFDQQLALLERITKPLKDVVLLFQQWRPNSLVSRQHFIGHLLGHVLQTNTLYWGWLSSVWETIIQSTPTRPKEVARRREPGHTSIASPTLLLTHLAAYLLTGQLHLTREKSFRCRALGEIVFGPELVQAAIDRAKESWVATGYSEREKPGGSHLCPDPSTPGQSPSFSRSPDCLCAQGGTRLEPKKRRRAPVWAVTPGSH